MTKLRGSIAIRFSCSRPTASRCATLVRAATADLKPPDGVVWTVDVDPLDMM